MRLLFLSLMSFILINQVSGADRISFVTFSPNRWDIFYFLDQRSEPIKLNDFEGANYDPVLSPDGKWVVFTSEKFGDPHLFVVPTNGSSRPKLLIKSNAMEDQATFSHDGSTLAFVSSHDGQTNIYTIPFLPTQTQTILQANQLTRNHGGNFRPVFSPNDRNIAFSSDFGVEPHGPVFNRLRGGSLFLIDSSGGAPRKITESKSWDGSPVFSKNGREIVYYSDSDLEEGSRIMRIHLETLERQALTTSNQLALSPAITPEGKIVYAVSGQTRRLFPMFSLNFEKSEWKTDWRLESISKEGQISPWAPHVKNCWIPKFSSVPESEAFVCFGLPKDSDGGLSLGGTRVKAGFPMIKRLEDREIKLFAITGYSSVLHPTQDIYLASEGPGLSINERCPFNQGRCPRSVLSEYKMQQESFNPLSVISGGAWVTHHRGKLFGGESDKLEIWKTTLDGSTSVQVSPKVDGNHGFVSYADDGQRFVYRTSMTGNFEIFYSDLLGRHHNITNHKSKNTFPAISHDGRHVAFSSDRFGQVEKTTGHRTFDLFLVDISEDGETSNLRQITRSSGHNAHVQFSPDDKYLIFASEMGGLCDEELITQTIVYNPQMYGEIYAYNIESETMTRLTHSKWENGLPSWANPAESLSSDSQRVFYHRGTSQKYVDIDAEGIWYRSIKVPGITKKVQLYATEVETLVEHLKRQSPAPKKSSQFLCGFNWCTDLIFYESGRITVYSEDADSLLSLF